MLKNNVICAVGAHPDDIELGCGGTLCKAIQKQSRVIAVYLSKGEKSGPKDVRVKESIAAMKVLGVDEVFFEDFPDTKIPDTFEVIDCLEKYAYKYQPDLVLSHTVNDVHQDHRNVGWVIQSAFRNVPKILAFETPRVKPSSFAPNFFININGYLEKKSESLKCHISQKDKRYLAYESTINLSSFRGNQVGVKEAEAFEVIKYLDL